MTSTLNRLRLSESGPDADNGIGHRYSVLGWTEDGDPVVEATEQELEADAGVASYRPVVLAEEGAFCAVRVVGAHEDVWVMEDPLR